MNRSNNNNNNNIIMKINETGTYTPTENFILW